ncbi:MAG: hypothetical protein ACPGJE_06525 [Wenzhouxiangellaceae bacterium]
MINLNAIIGFLGGVGLFLLGMCLTTARRSPQAGRCTVCCGRRPEAGCAR